jgi:hypothetical protein
VPSIADDALELLTHNLVRLVDITNDGIRPLFGLDEDPRKVKTDDA